MVHVLDQIRQSVRHFQIPKSQSTTRLLRNDLLPGEAGVNIVGISI